MFARYTAYWTRSLQSNGSRNGERHADVTPASFCRWITPVAELPSNETSNIQSDQLKNLINYWPFPDVTSCHRAWLVVTGGFWLDVLRRGGSRSTNVGKAEKHRPLAIFDLKTAWTRWKPDPDGTLKSNCEQRNTRRNLLFFSRNTSSSMDFLLRMGG